MSVWAQIAEVRARVTYAEITDASAPTTAQVQAWLDAAEAETRGILRAAELPTVYTAGSDAAVILGQHVLDYAVGRVQAAWATANGSGENEDGSTELREYNARLRDMEERPSAWGARLDVNGQSPQASRLARSHTTSGGLTSEPVYRIDRLNRVG